MKDQRNNGLMFMAGLLTSPAWAEELKDVRPPLDLPPSLGWLSFLAAVFAALGLLFLLRKFLRRRKKQKVKPEPLPRPAWEIAHEQLRALQAEDLAGRGMIKEFYIRLSDVVRHYIESRFTINAPDMTTEEFLNSLRGRAEFSSTQKGSLKDFLSCCDMVKFAKYGSSPQEIDRSFSLAVKLVDETKPEPVNVKVNTIS